MSSIDVGMDCTGRSCGFAEVSGDLGCTAGSSCFHAQLLEADESNFHDATLAKATSKINDILSSIPNDDKGRQLSFLHTSCGTMLAWVRHDIDVPANSVCADSPRQELISSLGLINPPERD